MSNALKRESMMDHAQLVVLTHSMPQIFTMNLKPLPTGQKRAEATHQMDMKKNLGLDINASN